MTIYIDDTATGGTDAGTSWANAYLTIAQAILEPAAAGEKVLIAYTHTDTGAGGTWGGTRDNPVIIISTDPADDSYRVGAAITGSSMLAWNGNFETYGMTLKTASGTPGDLTISASTDKSLKFFDCEIGWGDDFTLAGAGGVFVEFNDVIWNHLGTTSEAINISSLFDGGVVICRRVFTTGSNGSERLFRSLNQGVRIYMTNCDLSGWGAKNFGELREGASVHLIDCKIDVGGLSPIDVLESSDFLSERCGSGTDTPQGLTLYQTEYGTVESETAVYRTNGADDGEQANAQAWKMVSDASNCLERVWPLRSPPIAVYSAGGSSKTFKLFLAHDGIGGGAGGKLQDDEFWIELGGPDIDAGAQGHDETTRPGASATIPYGDPQTAAADLTTDSASTWNGSGIGTKEEVSITFTPNYAGPVFIRACLAKPNVTIHIDPKIDAA